jgi:hypothetical protein
MTHIQHYLDKISQRYQIGKATEHSYRGDLQNLLESLLPDIAVETVKVFKIRIEF